MHSHGRFNACVRVSGVLIIAGSTLPAASPRVTEPRLPSPKRTFSLAARRFAFTPQRIAVTEGDVVRIELRTIDIAHSLTIDGYRISKRVEPDHAVVLEFRAEHAGTFPFYCSLQIDDGCRQMRGELVVEPQR